MSVGATALRRPRLRRPHLRITRQRIRLAIAAAVLAALLLTGGWLWLRTSSFVAVEHVTITGAAGPDAAAIRSALGRAARKMTTLDVSVRQLDAAVSGFPEVKGLQVGTQFPHGLTVHVVELLPVAMVKLLGREVPVTGDGTLLAKASVTSGLPLIALAQAPIGGRLEDPWARAAARLLAAAPYRLLPRLAEAMAVSGHGVVIQIRNGPSLYFGDGTQPSAKWTAVLAVLADPGSAGASYIDVTDPARPVAGTTSGGGGGAGVVGGTAAAPTTSAAVTPTGTAGASPSTSAATPSSASAATPAATPTAAPAAASGGG